MPHSRIQSHISFDDENMDLWVLLDSTRQTTFRARKLELQRYGISPEQAGLLLAVQVMDNKATPTELSRYMLKAPHTLLGLVDRAVKKGLIKTFKDLDRKNLIRVAITEKGLNAYEKSAKRGPIRRIMGELTPEQKKKLRNYLERIYAKAREEIGLDIDRLPQSET